MIVLHSLTFPSVDICQGVCCKYQHWDILLMKECYVFVVLKELKGNVNRFLLLYIYTKASKDTIKKKKCLCAK